MSCSDSSRDVGFINGNGVEGYGINTPPKVLYILYYIRKERRGTTVLIAVYKLNKPDVCEADSDL